MMNKYDYRATIAYAKEEGVAIGEAKGEARGVAIGRAEGLKRGVLQAAKSMLKDGLKPERVARITKLPKEQIMALSN
jgi:predicted transposase YdaD